ncbi:MAG: ArsI/CadI family heavy metal resistance metalloenzyme [Rhodovibrionaceae bacterium]
MKRLHVGAQVEDLDASIRFYTALFGIQPSVTRDDYAKWMLDDPRVNFSITGRGKQGGIDHLGIQVESEDELAEAKDRLQKADLSLLDSGEVTCCYARSNKHWVIDPDGVPWETFLTHGLAEDYGQDTLSSELQDAQRRLAGEACC